MKHFIKTRRKKKKRKPKKTSFHFYLKIKSLAFTGKYSSSSSQPQFSHSHRKDYALFHSFSNLIFFSFLSFLTACPQFFLSNPVLELALLQGKGRRRKRKNTKILLFSSKVRRFMSETILGSKKSNTQNRKFH